MASINCDIQVAECHRTVAHTSDTSPFGVATKISIPCDFIPTEPDSSSSTSSTPITSPAISNSTEADQSCETFARSDSIETTSNSSGEALQTSSFAIEAISNSTNTTENQSSSSTTAETSESTESTESIANMGDTGPEDNLDFTLPFQVTSKIHRQEVPYILSGESVTTCHFSTLTRQIPIHRMHRKEKLLLSQVVVLVSGL